LRLRGRLRDGVSKTRYQGLDPNEQLSEFVVAR
jgi:hypothetical protein